MKTLGILNQVVLKAGISPTFCDVAFLQGHYGLKAFGDLEAT
jgi:hypothetical protein